MRTLTPWRSASRMPTEFRPLDVWQDFEQTVRNWFDTNGNSSVLAMPLVPPADIAETDKEYLVSMELPGLELSDVDVQLVGNELIVSGERKQKREDKDKRYRRVETVYGKFERRFDLPSGVRSEPEHLDATFHNGMLEVRLQKREQKAVTRIPVKTT